MQKAVKEKGRIEKEVSKPRILLHDPIKPIENFFDIHATTTRDDKVEIVATLLGSFILGASFAKEFFLNGRFEIRIFLFGLSCFILFIAVALVARVSITVFHPRKKVLSALWLFFFFFGSFAAVDLFRSEFIASSIVSDLRFQTLFFLSSNTMATNLLYLINRRVLLEALKQKTIYKYLLAPINGLCLGVIVTGIIVWWVN